VVLYNEPFVDKKGKLWPHVKIQRQMTWNFPSFTKTSKVFVNLIAIKKGNRFLKVEHNEIDDTESHKGLVTDRTNITKKNKKPPKETPTTEGEEN
jgi:hypothetical protein